jgi:hypothetical protein
VAEAVEASGLCRRILAAATSIFQRSVSPFVGKRLSHRDNKFPERCPHTTALSDFIRDKGLTGDSGGYAIANPDTTGAFAPAAAA